MADTFTEALNRLRDYFSLDGNAIVSALSNAADDIGNGVSDTIDSVDQSQQSVQSDLASALAGTATELYVADTGDTHLLTLVAGPACDFRISVLLQDGSTAVQYYNIV